MKSNKPDKNISDAARAYTDFQPQSSLNILDKKREKSMPVNTPAMILPMYLLPSFSLLNPAVIKGIDDVPIPMKNAVIDKA